MQNAYGSMGVPTPTDMGCTFWMHACYVDMGGSIVLCCALLVQALVMPRDTALCHWHRMMVVGVNRTADASAESLILLIYVIEC
jgi:hypothetical protein